MRRTRALWAQVGACICLFMAAGVAHGTEVGFGVSAGQFDLTRDHKTEEVGVDLYFGETRWQLRPHVGFGATGDDAIFGYVGARRDFPLGDSRWSLVPSFAVSAFEEGDGKDLGSALEFRSGLDLLYRVGSGWRVGAGIYHLSNASTSSQNPGANSLLFRIVSPPWRRHGER